MNANHNAQPAHRNRALAKSRRGNALLLVVAAVVIVAVLALIGWWMFGRSRGPEGPLLIRNTVASGPYDYVVLEQGEVQSASNIELRCEVRSRGQGSGITIIEVIPEGTMVQAGDVVIRLDSSALEQERVSQQIKVNGQQSLVAQATNLLKSAKIARTEYLEGTFKQEEMTIKSEVFVGEQALRSAQLSFDSAQRLAAKGLLGGLQLEGAQLGVDNARNTLEIASSKLGVLRKYTKDKMLTTFDSDIKSAEAKLSAEESSLQLESDKLKDIEDQIGKCTMRAQVPGQVVYANEYSSRSGTAEFVVEAGATVREQQPIVRLPSSNEMQVRALINEARVTLVRAGLPVSVRVDALKDEMIQGEVTKVNQYAEPGGWSGGNIKKYAAFIKILNPPPSLRSGMNAEVRIHVERRSEALQVAVQALAELKGRYFCLVENNGHFETREVKVGSTNNKVAVIESGLAAGDVVVLNPRAHTMLDLPDLPDPTPMKLGDIARTNPGEAPVRPAVARGPAGPDGPEAAEGRGGGRGGEGGGPGGSGEGKGKGKGRGSFTPATMVNRAFEESDTDKDGKFSKDEIAAMDDRRRQMVATADTNADGFVDRAETTTAAAAIAAQRARAGASGGPPATGGGE